MMTSPDVRATAQITWPDSVDPAHNSMVKENPGPREPAKEIQALLAREPLLLPGVFGCKEQNGVFA